MPIYEERKFDPESADFDFNLGSMTEACFLEINNKRYPVPQGETKIGRAPDVCTIVLDHQSLSRVHAVLESEGPNDTFVYYNGHGKKSGAWLGQMILKPLVRYKLNDGDTLKLGNVVCTFHVLKNRTLQQQHSNVEVEARMQPVPANSRNETESGAFGIHLNLKLGNRAVNNFNISISLDGCKPETIKCEPENYICKVPTQTADQEVAGNVGTPKQDLRFNRLQDSIMDQPTQLPRGGGAGRAENLSGDTNVFIEGALDLADRGIFEEATQIVNGSERRNSEERIFEDATQAPPKKRKLNCGRQASLSPGTLLNDGEDGNLSNFMGRQALNFILTNLNNLNLPIKQEPRDVEEAPVPATACVCRIKQEVPLERILYGAAGCPYEVAPLRTLKIELNDNDTQINILDQSNLRDDSLDPIVSQSKIAETSRRKAEGERPQVTNDCANVGVAEQDAEDDEEMTQLCEYDHETAPYRNPRQTLSQNNMATQIYNPGNSGSSNRLETAPSTSFDYSDNHDDCSQSLIPQQNQTAAVSKVDGETDMSVMVRFVNSMVDDSVPKLKDFVRILNSQAALNAQDAPLNTAPEPPVKKSELRTSSRIKVSDDVSPLPRRPCLEPDPRDTRVLCSPTQEALWDSPVKNTGVMAVSDSDETDCDETDTKPVLRMPPLASPNRYQTQGTSTLHTMGEHQRNASADFGFGFTQDLMAPLSLEMPSTQEFEESVAGVGNGPPGCPEPASTGAEALLNLSRGKSPDKHGCASAKGFSGSGAPVKGRPSLPLTAPPLPPIPVRSNVEPEASEEPEKPSSTTGNIVCGVSSTPNVRYDLLDLTRQPSSARDEMTSPSSSPSGYKHPVLFLSVNRSVLSQVSLHNKKTEAPEKRSDEECNPAPQLMNEEDATPLVPFVHHTETAVTTTHVLFTAFSSKEHSLAVTQLGGSVVNTIQEASVIVTDKVRRTPKFMAGLAMGIPIVSPLWVTESRSAQRFLDCSKFILRDKLAEEKWKFSLVRTLQQWKMSKLLRGYFVYSTANAKPPINELMAIVEACGGTMLTYEPPIWPEKTIILTCFEDTCTWRPFRKYRWLKIIHYEGFLLGVLQHEFNWEAFSVLRRKLTK